MSRLARFFTAALRREQRRKQRAKLQAQTIEEAQRIVASKAKGARTTKPAVRKGRSVAKKPVSSVAAPSVPPDVQQLAACLLLAHAVERSKPGLDGVLHLLRSAAPVIAVVTPVSGVSAALRTLMMDGEVPGLRLDLVAPGDRAFSRSAFTRSSEDGISTRCKTTLLRRDENVEARGALRELQQALADGHPILSFGQSRADLPDRVADVADLTLDTGHLTPAIVSAVIDAMLEAQAGSGAGSGAGESVVADRNVMARGKAAFPFPPDARLIDGYGNVVALDAGLCTHLALADLTIAIRPGRTRVAMVADLIRYAAENQKRKKAEDTDEGSGSGWQGGKSGKHNWKAGRGRGDDGGPTALVQPDTSDTAPHLDRLAGYGAAKVWATELQADLADWRAGSLAWADLSSRILLSGPPGTGKTLFARALANTVQVPLLVTSVASWLQGDYLSNTLKRMERAFSDAEAAKPAVLFIDEIDNIGSREAQDGREHGDYWTSIINQALTLLDGAARTEGVIVVGATNRPHVIDPALLRSGRLERHVRVELPDTASLAGILRTHIGSALDAVAASGAREQAGHGDPAVGRKAPIASPSAASSATELASTALLSLARLARGLVGADIERMVREAKGKARREKRDLAFADISAAIQAGRPKRDGRLRHRMAVHEAGHAVAHMVLGLGTPTLVSLEAGRGGFMLGIQETAREYLRADAEAALVLILAGRAAEEVLLGEASGGSGGGKSSDLAQATRLAAALEGAYGWGDDLPLIYTDADTSVERLALWRGLPLAQQVHGHLERAHAGATALITQHRAAVERLTVWLERDGSLEGEEIKQAAGFGDDAASAERQTVDMSTKTFTPTCGRSGNTAEGRNSLP